MYSNTYIDNCFNPFYIQYMKKLQKPKINVKGAQV
jgi:hypothetical protein